MIDPRSTRAYKLEKENRELKREIELLKEKLENTDYWWYEKQCERLEKQNKELKELFQVETKGDLILRKMIINLRKQQAKEIKSNIKVNITA